MSDARPFVLIDDARPEPQAGGNSLMFSGPREVLSCSQAEDVPGVLAAIESALASGYYVAGYMAYELGYVLEPKLLNLLPESQETPLIWIGVFDAPTPLTATQFADWSKQTHAVGAMQTQLAREEYIAQIARILEHIRNGDVYQINHTFQQEFEFSGSPLSLYAKLRQRQRAQYGALIHDGQRHILSLSPELFFTTEDGGIRTRPMKGTAPRAANPEDDTRRKSWLSHDEKSRAENLMIVDLLRNDLSRLSDVGSVEVTDLFSVETYPTLHQMTSGVTARLRANTRFSDIVHAIFPCGSVTGAPKIKAMEIIHAQESVPRGVYTGAVGYMGPDGTGTFNVAIRTLSIKGGRGTLGIGSGIVYDSDPAAEWDECHLKARFLTAQDEPFSLLETLLWEPDTGFALLERHIDRIEASAAYFCYPFDRPAVESALAGSVSNANGVAQRVRLLLDADGRIEVEAKPLMPIGLDGTLTFALAPEPINTDTPFVHHKTTNRAFYDDTRASLSRQTGCDEALFTNQRGELTEASFTNLFIQRDGILLTPPTQAGVLNGTLRQDLIDQGRAKECRLVPSDLDHADQIWLGNSVRGLMKAKRIL